MSVSGFAPEPLRVVCNSCGAEGFTFDYGHPDRAVECSCCPLDHDHGEAANATLRPCRPVTIHATAHLRLVDVNDLMQAMGEAAEADPAVFPVPAE